MKLMEFVLPVQWILVLLVNFASHVEAADCPDHDGCNPGYYWDSFCVCQRCRPCDKPDDSGLIANHEEEACGTQWTHPDDCPFYCNRETLPVNNDWCPERFPKVYSLSCPENVGTTTSPGKPHATLTWEDDRLRPTLTPEGSDVTISHFVNDTKVTSGEYHFPIEVTTVLHQAEKDGKAVANCLQEIIVDDAEQPNISCPEDIVLYTSNRLPQKVDEEKLQPNATDNSGFAEVLPSPYPSGYQYPVGEVDVTWTAEDPSGNNKSCSFRVINRDLSLICPKDTPNSTWSQPVIEGNKNSAVYANCSHESGTITGSNVTVLCYLYWEKKILANCSFIANAPKPAPGEQSGKEIDWHTIAIVFGILLPVLAIAVLVTLCHLRKGLWLRWKEKMCKSDDKNRPQTDQEEELTDLMGDKKDACTGTISSYQETREVPAADEGNKDQESQFHQLPGPSNKEHQEDGNNKYVPNGHPKNYGPKVMPEHRPPGTPEEEEEEELYLPSPPDQLDIRRPPESIMCEQLDIKRPPESSISEQDSIQSSALPSIPISTVSGTISPSQPSKPDKPEFFIPYSTAQSVFIHLKHFPNIDNYELRYCLKNDNQNQEVIRDLRPFEYQLTELAGLASGSDYTFWLKKAGSAEDGDDKFGPVERKTSGGKCCETIDDLLNDQDLVGKLCTLLDPRESLWKCIGGSFGLTNDELSCIKYYKDPDTHPVTRQLLENIRDKKLGNPEEMTISKLLREMHYRCTDSGTATACELIWRWHERSQCPCCLKEMFDCV